MKKILGIIPARGGSKGVPNKNIRELKNKPLIHYTIEAAQGSKLLTDFIVSTESKKIVEICKNINVEVPFLRPIKLAGDRVESFPVVEHALKKMEKYKKVKYHYFVLLQPTTPFRTASDIDKSCDLLINSDVDSVVSVCNVGAMHPLRMKKITKNDRLENYINQDFENMKPRQELPTVYIRNGAIYASKSKVLQKYKSLVGPDCAAHIMSPEQSINIDTILDFKLAELIIS